jgi:chromosome segregation ATPase
MPDTVTDAMLDQWDAMPRRDEPVPHDETNCEWELLHEAIARLNNMIQELLNTRAELTKTKDRAMALMQEAVDKAILIGKERDDLIECNKRLSAEAVALRESVDGLQDERANLISDNLIVERRLKKAERALVKVDARLEQYWDWVGKNEVSGEPVG